MKKFVCGIVVGALVATAIGATSAGVWENIDVLRNDIRVVVNGEEITADNFLYKDTTYLPLRAVSSALGENVEYDEETNTAFIGEKVETAIAQGKYTPPEEAINQRLIYLVNGIYYISQSFLDEAISNSDKVALVEANADGDDVIWTFTFTNGTVKEFRFEFIEELNAPHFPYDTYVEEIEPYL